MAGLITGGLGRPQKNPLSLLDDEDQRLTHQGGVGETPLIGAPVAPPSGKTGGEPEKTDGLYQPLSTGNVGEPVLPPPPGPAPEPTPKPEQPAPAPEPQPEPAPEPEAVGYDPVTREVGEDETVQGQLNKVLDKDSLLMQSARGRAMQTANSRGLLNSSMAAQAGEQAVIDSAMPIASQDAATFGKAASENMAAKNEGGQFNAKAKNDLVMQKLKGDQARGVAEIEANYKQMMQASQSASALFNGTMENIGRIMDDPNTTAEQKQAAVDHQINLLKASLAVMGSIAGLDLTSLLDFSQLTPGPGPTPQPPPAPPPGPIEPPGSPPHPPGTPPAPVNPPPGSASGYWEWGDSGWTWVTISD